MCWSDAVVLMVCVTRVAKTALDQALSENDGIDDLISSDYPNDDDQHRDLQQPLIIKTDSSRNGLEN